MSLEDQKRRAARRAVELVEPGMVLGLGTGSTARFVLEALATRLRADDDPLDDVAGVPTSRATADAARELAIPLTDLDRHPRLDLTLDGADEVDPRLDVIKGLGGALLWEKIVAASSERLVIVVDESKRVDVLGERAPLPVEVVPLGWRTHLAAVETLGAQAELRVDGGGEPFLTDGGHYILDCRFRAGLPDPERVHRELKLRVGVVETGLFLGMADVVVVGTDDGAELMQR